MTLSQQIAEYYSTYKDLDVTFNKQVVRAVGLNNSQVFLRLRDLHIHCIVYSSSLSGAKVVANLDKDLLDKIREANNLVSLRLSFLPLETAKPISFFITSKIIGIQPYDLKKPGLNFITLTYTKKPPEDLIQILGDLLDANINAKRRKEERIILDEKNARKLELKTRECRLSVRDHGQKCILRDISFSGTQVITAIIEGLEEKGSLLVELAFESMSGTLNLPGNVMRIEELATQPEFTTLGIHFVESKIPMAYKNRINNFFK